MQFRDIGKRLQHKQINSAFKQRRHLGREHLLRFIKGRRSVRFDAQPERTDGAGYKHAISGGFAGDLCGPNVDFAQTAFQTIGLKLICRSAESICLNDFSAGADVFRVNFADQIGSDQIQLVV